MSKEVLHLQKGFNSLTTTDRTKTAQPNFRPLTAERSVNTVLAQMLTGKSATVAQELLGMMGEIVYQSLTIFL